MCASTSMSAAAITTSTSCEAVMRMPATSNPVDSSRIGNASGFGPKIWRIPYSRVNETPIAVMSTASRGLLRSGR